jgi:hypothetical protein
LANENIHSFIIQTLRETGIELIPINEVSKGIEDEGVIAWVLKMNYTLLTEGEDFGE